MERVENIDETSYALSIDHNSIPQNAVNVPKELLGLGRG